MNKTILSLLLLASTFQVFPDPVIKSFEPDKLRTVKKIEKYKIDYYESTIYYPEVRAYKDALQVVQAIPESKPRSHFFNNPAGCSFTTPENLSPDKMLENVQAEIGDSYNLSKRRITFIWNGKLESFVETSEDLFVYEFEFNEFQSPFTYKGDQIMTSFVQNGFAVWFRTYSGIFRLLAVPMIPGVEDSIWSEYIRAYWQKDGLPNDKTIVPVSKKLPCHWMIDEGYVSNQTVQDMFPLDWHIPDYLAAGRQYLADTCAEAYRVSQEEIGFWDATSMCGPLTWQIINDSNGFPYRVGSYDVDAGLFISANPRYWGKRPWTGFDPETYDMVRTEEHMAGYDFETKGNLFAGDILFSYGSPDQWSQGGGNFSHIFMVAGIDENNARLSVTNLVKNHLGVKDCSISEVSLYTPGDRVQGVINYEWNNHGYGITGKYGFDVFRWKWITYHQEGQAREYTVRLGETIETIAFDWKVSHESILKANQLTSEVQLYSGQVITLPVPAD